MDFARKNGIAPGYGQESFISKFATNELILVASKSGKDGSITINQDVAIYACKANVAGEKNMQLPSPRKAWLQVIRGNVKINDYSLAPGDGAAIVDTESLRLVWPAQSEFLLFDLP